jgi:AAA domain/TrwC relaxase
VRRGRGGAIREHGEGFVAAAFRHRTSRAQDPHLHTHVIVANLARSADGAWRALDGEAILRTYRLAAGYLYEAHLRHELSASLGVRWTEPVKGMAEIEGVPEEAIRAFSTRRQSLVEQMEAMGTSGFAASRVAALATRERKEAVDLPDLRDAWLARASEMGLGAIELRGLPDRVPAVREATTIAIDSLTAHQPTVTAPELVRAVAGAACDGMGVEDVLASVDEITRRPELTHVGDDPAPGRPARFTTRSLLDLERQALGVALDGRGAGAPIASGDALTAALAEAPIALSDEQGVLVEEAALSPDRIVCAIGAAGAGKTTALQVLGDALSRSDIPVLGAAPSGRAADELERATDIPAQTLHSLLADARQSGGLPPGCVLVVDEAGMAETRVLAPVLRMVEEVHGKALLVGDSAQLPAVGPGGLYGALCERLGAVQLEENYRQREAPERGALARLRDGDAEGYLGHAAREGRLLIADDATRAKEQVLADWWRAAAEGNLRETVMLAHRRADVSDLNEAARALMREAGLLGERALVPASESSARATGSSAARTTRPSAFATARAQRCTTSSPSSASSHCRSTPGRAANSPNATPPSTSSTVTPTPPTPPKVRRSIGRSSSCAPRVPWPNGATSPPPGRGPRLASMRWDRRSRLRESASTTRPRPARSRTPSPEARPSARPRSRLVSVKHPPSLRSSASRSSSTHAPSCSAPPRASSRASAGSGAALATESCGRRSASSATPFASSVPSCARSPLTMPAFVRPRPSAPGRGHMSNRSGRRPVAG